MKIKVLLSILVLVTVASAQTYTFSILHAFRPNPDGQTPMGTIVEDAAGNLYGTTEQGGWNYGTVWELAAGTRTEKILKKMAGVHGSYPMSGLAGTSVYYGTTQTGGGHREGTVFQVVNGIETVLHAFTGGTDGAHPTCGVVLDGAGNVYGVAGSGNGGQGGGIFRIDPKGGFTVISAIVPGSLAVDQAGDVFYLDGPLLGQVGVGTLYTFPSAAEPSGLQVSADGLTFTGVTAYGGTGYGSVWQWTAQAGETDLYQFPASQLGYQNPMGLVTLDGQGNAFGTFYNAGPPAKTFGAVWQVQLGTTNPPVILHQFQGTLDGGYPVGAVTLDASGNIYGTATQGGRYYRGTVWELVRQ